MLSRQIGSGEAKTLHELGIEALLDGPDRQPFAVLGLVGVVPGCAGIKQVDTALVAPGALRVHAIHQRHQISCAVDHGGVHHLAHAGLLRLEQRAYHAEGQEHATAAEIADQVQRRHRRLTLPADAMQDAGQRDVVDVMAGALRQRTVLPESGHAAEHQLRVDLGESVGSSPSRSMTPGRKPSISVGLAASCRTMARPASDFTSSASERPRAAPRTWSPGPQSEVGCLAPIYADHLGSHVGQQHRREWRRPDAVISMMRNPASGPIVVIFLLRLVAPRHSPCAFGCVFQCRSGCLSPTGVDHKRASVKRDTTARTARPCARVAQCCSEGCRASAGGCSRRPARRRFRARSERGVRALHADRGASRARPRALKDIQWEIRESEALPRSARQPG